VTSNCFTRAAAKARGVSCVLVVGGAGDFFDVCDHVVMMDEYVPRDVTARAKAIAAAFAAAPAGGGGAEAEAAAAAAAAEAAGGFPRARARAPQPRSFALNGGKLASRERGKKVQYGEVDIELGALEQLVEESQTRAIGEARAARAWHMHMPHADARHPARHASRAACAIRVSSRRARSTSETSRRVGRGVSRDEKSCAATRDDAEAPSRRVGRDGGRDETVVARGAPLDAASAAS